MELMTVKDYCEAVGVTQSALIKATGISHGSFSNWNRKVQTPSLLHMISLFMVSDGNVGVLDMLSDKDEYLLQEVIKKLPEERLEDLIIKLSITSI